MTAVLSQRAQRRRLSETALLDAAWESFARSGPDGVPLRDLAAAAGCTHALVARYFGSKHGLVTAVGNQLTARTAATLDEVWDSEADPVAALLSVAREHPDCMQLLVRSALGDLQSAAFPRCLRVERLLSAELSGGVSGGRQRRGRRARIVAYAAASMLLGWLSFDEFLIAGTGLGRVAAMRRDAAVAITAWQVLGLAGSATPRLGARDISVEQPAAESAQAHRSAARGALLDSSIELFAQFGPASVSVRDIARHAGVNQGLIYRHFGSKEALLAEAIEQGSSGLFSAALAPEGFDHDAMSHLLHHGSPAPRLIARTQVDGLDISTLRHQYPVLRRLLDDLDSVSSGARFECSSDARIAVACAAGMTLGSVLWGEHLRDELGLIHDDGIESALADLAPLIISWAAPTS